MKPFPFGLLVFLAGIFSFSWIAQAQEDKTPAEAKPAAADAKPLAPEEIDKLMEELDANRFSQRQAAQQKLAEAGKGAFPALEKGASSVSREVATRSLEILKKHFEGGDDATKAAAKEVLERLAKSNDAALARRAGEVLTPPKPPMQPPQFGPPRIGNIQIQVGGGNAFKKVTMKNVNGVKEIEAEENGRKVKINDDPANGIKMEVTEKKDGKETTQKYEAKNAAELKTKHPEAHKLYEEYTRQPAGIRIQGIQIPGGAFPPGFPGIPGAPAIPGAPGLPNLPAMRRIGRLKVLRPEDLQDLQDKTDAILNELTEAARLLKDAKPDSDDFKKAQERIEAAKKQAEELKAKLAE